MKSRDQMITVNAKMEKFRLRAYKTPSFNLTKRVF
jgi:hypothetical protein